MLSHIWWKALGAGVTAAALIGCSNSPPGAGFTNGDQPTAVAEEKPAMRTDLPVPGAPAGDAPLAENAASAPATSGNNGGTGGRNMAPAEGRPAGSDNAPVPPGTPPKVETSAKGEPTAKANR